MKIVMQAPGKLIPHERNSRTHTPAQIAKIAEAIKLFGFLNPVVVADGKILAGHARVEAAKQLSLKEVPTIDASALSEGQRRAYIIADNRLSEDAGWNDTILREELHFLKSLGEFEISLTGFDDEQLKRLGAEDAYKPTLNPERGSSAVTGAEVGKAQASLEGRYAEAGQQDLVEVTCPHCGEDFKVQRGQV